MLFKKIYLLKFIFRIKGGGQLQPTKIKKLRTVPKSINKEIFQRSQTTIYLNSRLKEEHDNVNVKYNIYILLQIVTSRKEKKNSRCVPISYVFNKKTSNSYRLKNYEQKFYCWILSRQSFIFLIDKISLQKQLQRNKHNITISKKYQYYNIHIYKLCYITQYIHIQQTRNFGCLNSLIVCTKHSYQG
eukprot:TRINITY_DN4957_c0_g1_i3.p1 TRINITY_DN4957_c0_g1~~TRINITY_DN4957_c0_g1_i3.p1  ORF type:complete len:187 (+),score=-20.78 TRINITY_DN4957_c0_g1_i3:308-868(+)